MIPPVSDWHEHHTRTAEAIETRLHRGDQMIVAAHSLVETYAVWTRLPPGRRLSPRDARAVIDGSFLRHGQVVALPSRVYRGLLERLESGIVAGGRAYDALILMAAEYNGVDAVLTFNGRDFTALAGPGTEVVVL